MSITVVEADLSELSRYAAIPSVLTVSTVLDVVDALGEPGGARLVPRVLAQPYVKDYDAPPAEPPGRWPALFDVSYWGFLTAHSGGTYIGGAAIAWRTPDVDLLEGRDDLALLWDLRVHPDYRRHGVGTALFSAVEAWANTRGARTLKVETQNVNLPACRFYASRGCLLGAFHRQAYPELPDEVQLLWYKDLLHSDHAVERRP